MTNDFVYTKIQGALGMDFVQYDKRKLSGLREAHSGLRRGWWMGNDAKFTLKQSSFNSDGEKDKEGDEPCNHEGVREEGADSAAERGFAGNVLKCFMAKCTKYRRGNEKIPASSMAGKRGWFTGAACGRCSGRHRRAGRGTDPWWAGGSDRWQRRRSSSTRRNPGGFSRRW